MSKTNKPFSFFPVFDKEANNKVVSQIMKAGKSPIELIIKANRFSQMYGLTKEQLAAQILDNGKDL